MAAAEALLSSNFNELIFLLLTAFVGERETSGFAVAEAMAARCTHQFLRGLVHFIADVSWNGRAPPGFYWQGRPSSFFSLLIGDSHVYR